MNQMSLNTAAAARAEPALPPLVRGGPLDLLRFLAAAFFVLYHYEQHAPASFASIHPGLGRGYLGTDFFLILSGYVLGRTYGPRLLVSGASTFSFMVKRIARLWPPYILALSALVALAVAAKLAGQTANNPEGFDFPSLPGHIFLLQAWGLGFKQGWNPPTWTLSALVFCYILFPTLYRAMKPLKGLALLAVGVAAVGAADLICRAFGVTLYDFDQEIGVVRAVPLFILGIVLAKYVPPAVLGRFSGVIWIACFAAVFGLQLIGRLDFVSILAIGATVAFAGMTSPRKPSELIALGGKLSFSLYLTHTLTGILWYRVLGRLIDTAALHGPVAWLAWASAFPVALVCAFAFHKLVEWPLKGWSDRTFARRVPPVQAAPVGA
jgi:peptidoglycan/LPS O-acetylase OafA/YrhL